jgi:hypothetical protein
MSKAKTIQVSRVGVLQSNLAFVQLIGIKGGSLAWINLTHSEITALINHLKNAQKCITEGDFYNELMDVEN